MQQKRTDTCVSGNVYTALLFAPSGMDLLKGKKYFFVHFIVLIGQQRADLGAGAREMMA